MESCWLLAQFLCFIRTNITRKSWNRRTCLGPKIFISLQSEYFLKKNWPQLCNLVFSQIFWSTRFVWPFYLQAYHVHTIILIFISVPFELTPYTYFKRIMRGKLLWKDLQLWLFEGIHNYDWRRLLTTNIFWSVCVRFV